ncbi:hypothetical protein CaCOL14_005979 [Colletotrichum acutatum]
MQAQPSQRRAVPPPPSFSSRAEPPLHNARHTPTPTNKVERLAETF